MANDLAHRIAQLWLAAAGLLIAAVAFLIPAHISGIDSRVLDIVGEKGPTLTALAREHITAGNIGVAQMLLRASDAGLAPRPDLVAHELEKARSVDPEAQAWGGPASLLARVMGVGSNEPEATPILRPLLRRAERNRLRSVLGGTESETVRALLRSVVVTNFTQLPSVATAAGQPVEAATVLAALMVQENAVSPALANAWGAAAASALERGDSVALETLLSDLIVLGLRLDWNQITSLTTSIQDPRSMHAFASMMERYRDHLPTLYSSAIAMRPSDAVITYLRDDPEKGATDLRLASLHGVPAMQFLVVRRAPVFHGRFQSSLPLDPVVMPMASVVAILPMPMTVLKFCALFIGLVMLLTSGPRAFTSTESIAPRKAMRVFGVTMAVIALAFIALINEPFLLENRQMDELAFWELPTGKQIQVIVENEIAATMEHTALIALGGFLLVQAILYGFCLLRLSSIRRQAVPDSVKLHLIDNEENLFDAGLYVGLGGTVLSLVFLALGVIKPSLMAAYASTLFGILFVAIFKIFHLRPFRRRLILGAAQSEAEAA